MGQEQEGFVAFDPFNFFIIDPRMQEHTAGGLLEVGYKRMPQGYDAVKDNVSVPVYHVVPAAAVTPAERVVVYWCGYAHNSTQFTVLDSKAQWMLTPTMDGCSFGVGHPSKDGVIVAHANMESAQKKMGEHKGMQTAQTKQLKDFFKRVGGRSPKIMSPIDYRMAKDEGMPKKAAIASATTFGVRFVDGWKFFRHRYLAGSGTYTILDTGKL